jgi:hypothetical protein
MELTVENIKALLAALDSKEYKARLINAPESDIDKYCSLWNCLSDELEALEDSRIRWEIGQDNPE